MARSFAITTPDTDSLRADAKGHAEAVFTVTNTTSRPIRGMAKAEALGDTKREWLGIEGETERDFAAGATHQFTVTFDAPVTADPKGGSLTGDTKPAAGSTAGTGATASAVARKYTFRLDVSSALKRGSDEDFTEGPTVTVEVAAAAAPTPAKKFPLWIIFVIVGIVLLIGCVILALKSCGTDTDDAETPMPTPVATATATATASAVTSPSSTPTPASTPTESDESRCFDFVQGQIAWNYQGNKSWSPNNVRDLCRGTSNASQPPRCFERVMHGGINYGGGTRWQWKNALDLCAGTNDADRTISCFQARIARGTSWQVAIKACNGR